MTRAGAPGTWNRELHWAFSAAGRRRWAVPTPFTMYGYRITESIPKLPWGRSTHAAGYLSHGVRVVYLGWRRGRFVGAQARWRCGAETRWFRLEAEPSGPHCPLCLIDRKGDPPHDHRR